MIDESAVRRYGLKALAVALFWLGVAFGWLGHWWIGG
jgi:hypothetical protein